jgi:spore coat protein U-like protein
MRNLLRLFAACTVIAPLATFAASTTNDLTVTATVTASCAVNAAAINFPTYDPIADSGRTAQTNLEIICTKGHPATITLDDGLNFDAAAGRRMKSGPNFIAYELFQDAGATTRFGIGAGEEYAYVGQGKTADNTSVTVYAVIDPNQDANAGTYSDSVVINIAF